jgi:pimeloyl-ACP methyl ester carboxylesterase
MSSRQATVEDMMFLPGASGNTSFWRPLAARLQRPGRRRFVGWPGFGGWPPEPQVKGIADLVPRVTAELDGPVDLFAQSMGGIVAVLTAPAQPALVRHLVLSATSGGIDMTGMGAFDWRRSFRASNPGAPTWFEHERWDLADRLREISIPVLLLWGDADPISPVAVGRRLAGLFPNAELLVVPGGTHDLAAERVDDILPHVERHLAKRGSQTP